MIYEGVEIDEDERRRRGIARDGGITDDERVWNTPGSSTTTPASTTVPAAPGGGSPFDISGYSSDEQEWLRRNQNPNGSYDTHRLNERNNDTSGRIEDSQDPRYYDSNGNPTALTQSMIANGVRPGGSGGTSFGNDTRMTPIGAAYQNYLGTPNQAPQVDLSPITNLLTKLTTDQQSDRERQQMERAAIRDLLMGRIGEASKPVDVNAPGIKEQLAAQRLSRQRSEERQRSQLAARLAPEGLLDSGAFDTGLAGIQQMRGEGEAEDIADVLGSETQAKRQELMQLYQMAIASGDAEMARNLQQQLAAIDAQMQQQGMRDVNSRFGQDLDFRKSSFLDNLGLQIMLAQMGADERATEFFR